MNNIKTFVDMIRTGVVVYDDGRLYRHRKPMGRLTTRGYRQLTKKVDGKVITAVEHRVIYAYFNNLKEWPSGLEINHKNGVKTDNRIENLEVVTQSENMKHAYKTGLKQKMIGVKNPAAKLGFGEVEKIKTLIEKGDTNVDIGKVFGVSDVTIGKIKRGLSWVGRDTK